ncbi:MAG: Fe-S protein assembly chaperone HscA [SAR324 cluster bacterium]|nr:Fe-S protein assembly chaperone HscA [SAR324 cluster bacterium]
MNEPIIGIDLGTTNTLAALVFDEGPEVIGSGEGLCMIPSLLSMQDSRWIAGEEARPYLVSSPSSTVYSVKRLMGRGYEELEDEIGELSYRVEEAQRRLVKVAIDGKTYSPQELSGAILSALKQKAEKALGHSVEKAVITVPAYFDDAQRQATRDAARIAGLEIVRIINEPTAAAIAYGLDEKTQGYVAVYDLGGGTFDISILEMSGKLFKVLATHGDTRLGGDDIDRRLIELFRRRIRLEHPGRDCEDSQSIQILRKAAEELKISLSSSPESEYSIDLPASGIRLKGVLSAEELNREIQPLLERTYESCRKALKDAGLKRENIREVVLVGGSTVVPAVRRGVGKFFGRSPHVAIDPYKVVVLGAAIQGHLLTGGRRDFLLLDVIPLALGIETLGGTFSKLIIGNTSLPAEEKEIFTTHVDHQTGIDINIYQGERELVKDCRCLGQFKLQGIPPMKAGLPLVEVTFRVDSNGLLTVSAFEKRSGTEARIEVIPSHGLTRQEIDAIMEESLEHAQDDFNQRQLIEFRQSAERVFRGIEQNWPVAEEVLSSREKEAIRKQMGAVQKALKKDDSQALKSELDSLGDLTRPLADSAMGRAVLAELQDRQVD